MFSYIWPIALAVISNVIYHICSKSSPDNVNPFAALVVTYAVGAVSSLILFYCTAKDKNLIVQFSKLNWAPFVLGIVIVGLEVGFMYAYKAGWQVSTASVVQSSVLAVILLFVGLLIFKEKITVTKAVGMGICLVGLYFVNK